MLIVGYVFEIPYFVRDESQLIMVNTSHIDLEQNSVLVLKYLE